MKLGRKFLVAVSGAALAFPAVAQDVAAEPAEAAAGAEAAVESTGVAAEAEANAEATASAQTEAGPVTEATPADVLTGIEVRDANGGMVGTVETVDSEGAVVSTGNVRAKLPFRSFGKNDRGLVISLTRTQLEAAARAQNPG